MTPVRPTRSNRLKRSLAAGRVVVGATVSLARNPAVIMLLDSVGLDYVELDLEHSDMPLEIAADMAVQARALDLPLLVRPPRSHADLYGPFLEAGAWGLCLPGVESVEQARDIVHATRHAPLGNRGTFEPGPQNDYQPDPQDLAYLNGQIHVTLILQSERALRAADEILAIEGIDAVELCRDSLAREIGARTLGDREAALVAAAKRCGKIVSMPVTGRPEMVSAAARGAGMLRYQSDEQVLRQAFAHAIALSLSPQASRGAE